VKNRPPADRDGQCNPRRQSAWPSIDVIAKRNQIAVRCASCPWTSPIAQTVTLESRRPGAGSHSDTKISIRSAIQLRVGWIQSGLPVPDL
jgi:hypothetical protein